MTKTSVLRYAAIGLASVSLAGFAAASTGTITGPTGPQSNNNIKLHNSFNSTSFNLNGTGVSNVNGQGAASGNVTEADNTTVTGGGSGGTENNNTTSTTVMNDNTGSNPVLAGLSSMDPADDSASIGTTGPQSKNSVDISNKADVTNVDLNLTEVQNESLQSAQSGNVEIKDNTTASGGSSGPAENNNNTTTSISNSN